MENHVTTQVFPRLGRDMKRADFLIIRKDVNANGTQVDGQPLCLPQQ